jgi:D-aspartate ligase
MSRVLLDAGSGPAPAVVVGLDCITGLQTARILGRRGVPVIGVASDTTHFCARTRVPIRVVKAEPEGEALVEALERLAVDLTGPAALFPCTDAAVRTLAGHRDRLVGPYALNLPEGGLVAGLMDKESFHVLAEREGLPLPRTIPVYDRASAEAAAIVVGFPAILKPMVRHPRWDAHVPAKVFRVRSAHELMDVWERWGGWTDGMVAQEWIPGPDSELYSCNCYFGLDGELLVTFIARKLRQWPPGAGTSCLGEECRNDRVLEMAHRLFTGLSFKGLGYLEVKRDPRTGEHVLIEANVGRPTGRSAIAEAGGVELLYTAYCDLMRLPLPDGRTQRYTGAKWIFWRQDLRSALHSWRQGELTLREWARTLKGRKACAVLSASDPLPFLADLASGPLRWLRRRRRATTDSVPAPSGREADDGSEPVVDYDIGGEIRIRLVGPSEGDRAAVERQVGANPSKAPAVPYVTVRYVDHLRREGLRYVEVGRSGFTEDGFFVKAKGPAGRWARVPFETLGRPSEIVCERGIGAVPLLKDAIGFSALSRGYVPLHASAFEFGGTGVLVAGWSHGGKTSALLAFGAEGGRYVGDDLVFLSEDGAVAFGLPAPLRLSPWHLEQRPELRALLGWRRRFMLSLLRVVPVESGTVPPAFRGVARFLRSSGRRVRERSRVGLPLEAVFPAGTLRSVRPRVLFLMTSGSTPRVQVEPLDRREMAARLGHAQELDDLGFRQHYHAFRFAFPDRASRFVEGAAALRQRLLARSLEGMETFLVRHPYPPDFAELYEAMAPWCVAPDAVQVGSPRARGTA